MRQLAPASIFFLLAAATAFYAVSHGQEAGSNVSSAPASKAKDLKIVPLVRVAAGETKQLLLSTWCTVGVTRGGGFGLTEMRDAKAVGGGHAVKTYRRDGVTISVPDFDQGEKFAASEEFAPLSKHHLAAFEVTVAAATDAKPGLLEMHLVDATCGGYCETDFRVLIVEPQD